MIYTKGLKINMKSITVMGDIYGGLLWSDVLWTLRARPGSGLSYIFLGQNALQ